MSINETIIQAVTPIVPVCVPDVYRPDAGETPAEVYCVFNYTESPDVFGDDEPQAIRTGSVRFSWLIRCRKAGLSANDLSAVCVPRLSQASSTSARMQVLYWGRRAEPASGSATPAPSM